MGTVIRSELVKLRRPGPLLVAPFVAGLLAAAVSLATILVVPAQATGTMAAARGASQLPMALGHVTAFDGAVAGARFLAPQLALISLVVFAGSFVAETKNGMLRTILVFEPRRTRLLLGKLTVLAGWALMLTTVQVTGGAIGSVAAALTRGVNMSAWWTLDAAGAMAQVLFTGWLAACACGIFGLILAVTLGSLGAAIAVGFAYLLFLDPMVAGLLATVVDIAGRTPGAILNQVAWGAGADTAVSGLGLGQALVAMSVMSAAGVALAIWLFERRSLRT